MTKKHKIEAVLYHLFVCLFGLLMIYPVLWMISGSLKNNTEILNGGMNLIPPAWRVENFANGWKGFGGISFATFFSNSFFVAAVSTLATVLSSACVAYAFSRVKYKGRNIWFTAMICTMMIPTQIILVPQYIIYNKLGFVGTYLPLILPHFFGQAFFIYQMMQFGAGIPKDLDEAAIIDGAGPFQVLKHITVPLSKPMFATVGIMVFIWSYNDLITSLVYISDQKLKPVCVILTMVSNMHGTDYGAMMAAIFITVIPVLILYMMSQEMVIKGLTAGAVKG